MKLTLRRSQASTGILSKTVQFSLNAKVQLSDQEAADVKKYKMGSEIIYSKDRMGYNEHANDSAGGMARNLAAIAAAITITVDDLVRGKTINCKDILEMMAIVEQVKGACGNFKAMLEASAQFEGEETIDY
jgi:hypothetical protein